MQLTDDKRNFVIIAQDKRKLLGFISVVYLKWDSRLFGFRMAKINNFISAKENYEENIVIKKSLIKAAIDICNDNKIMHICARFNTDDFSSIHILEKNGFNLMDTIATYVFNKNKHDIPVFKDLFKIRPFKMTDLKRLISLSRVSFLKNRFYNDVYLKDKAYKVYSEWIKDYCLNKNKGSLVAQDKYGKAVGFLVYKLDINLAKITDCKVIGHGLAAVSPKSKGAFLALVKATIQKTKQYYNYAEFDVQVYNYEAIRVYSRFKFDLINTKHTFHKWLR